MTDFVVLDNIVPQLLIEESRRILPRLPVTFGIVGEDKYDNHHFFGWRWKYWDIPYAPNIVTDIWNCFDQNRHILGNNVKELQIEKADLNITTPQHYGQAHVDSPEEMELWSLVYMVKGEKDEGMDFYEEDHKTIKHTVDFVPGRMVAFPSHIYHRGRPPSEKTSPRVTLAFVFGGKLSHEELMADKFSGIFKD